MSISALCESNKDIVQAPIKIVAPAASKSEDCDNNKDCGDKVDLKSSSGGADADIPEVYKAPGQNQAPVVVCEKVVATAEPKDDAKAGAPSKDDTAAKADTADNVDKSVAAKSGLNAPILYKVGPNQKPVVLSTKDVEGCPAAKSDECDKAATPDKADDTDKADKQAAPAKADAAGKTDDDKPTVSAKVDDAAKADDKPAVSAKTDDKVDTSAKADDKPTVSAKADDRPDDKADTSIKADDKPATPVKADDKPAASVKADTSVKADDKPATAVNTEDRPTAPVQANTDKPAAPIQANTDKPAAPVQATASDKPAALVQAAATDKPATPVQSAASDKPAATVPAAASDKPAYSRPVSRLRQARCHRSGSRLRQARRPRPGNRLRQARRPRPGNRLRQARRFCRALHRPAPYYVDGHRGLSSGPGPGLSQHAEHHARPGHGPYHRTGGEVASIHFDSLETLRLRVRRRQFSLRGFHPRRPLPARRGLWRPKHGLDSRLRRPTRVLQRRQFSPRADRSRSRAKGIADKSRAPLRQSGSGAPISAGQSRSTGHLPRPGWTGGSPRL